MYSEMGTILQYSHTSDTPFDFNDKNAKAGFHRLGTENSFKNAPSGVNPVYSNVLVVRNNAWDTLSMTIYLYTKGANSSVVYKTGNTTDWANLSWSVYATKSDLTDIIMVKSFRGTSITIAENASEKISIPISTPTGYKVAGKISEMWINGPEMYLSQVDLTPTTFTGFAANLRNSEATSIPTISVLFVKS